MSQVQAGKEAAVPDPPRRYPTYPGGPLHYARCPAIRNPDSRLPLLAVLMFQLTFHLRALLPGD